MKTIIKIVIFISYVNSYSQNIYADKSIYIPKNLSDSFIELDKFLPSTYRDSIKTLNENDFSSESHFGLGMWMRNNWELWTGSRLARYFKNKLKIQHPDDMSGIILISYHRYLNNRDINLSEQVKSYQNYWKVVTAPHKKKYPKEVPRDLVFKTGLYYDDFVLGQGFLQVGTLTDSPLIWFYDYHFGWKRGTNEEIEKLTNNPNNRAELVREYYNQK